MPIRSGNVPLVAPLWSLAPVAGGQSARGFPESASPELDRQLNQARLALAGGDLSPAEAARLRSLLVQAERALSRGDTAGARRYADEAEKATGTAPGETQSTPGGMKGSGRPEDGENGKDEGPDSGEEPGALGKGERRTYQDRSGDPGVSFREPTSMTRGQAEIMVRYHEGQHYRRNVAQADASGRKVVYAYTKVEYRTDPDTGERYIRGGKTVVKTAPDLKPKIDARA